MADQQSSGIAEEGKISTDVNEQAENIEKGLTSMPLDVAKSSISRWQSTLSSLGDSKLQSIASKLGDLNTHLQGGSPEGSKIGPVLTELGQHVKTVAGDRSGALQSALNKLSSALTQAGSSLK